MEITNDQFDRAFAEFQEFGQGVRVEDRWREVLFDVAWRDFPALRARCEEIQSFALTLAEQVRDGNMSDDAARRQLAATYPFLTQERLDRAWKQATYFAMT